MNAKAIIAITATAALVLTMPIRAQEPVSASAPASVQGELEVLVASGELMRVDTMSKLIEVRTGRDTFMTFTYGDETEVIRADRSPRGLATMAGTQVTVRYTKHGESNVAMQIEIRDSKK